MKNVEVGDMLAGSWGATMTLWMFARVVKVTEKQVVVQEVFKHEKGGKMYELKVAPDFDTPDYRHSGTTHRVKRHLDKEYIWIPKFRCLLYKYDPNREYFENHMD